MLKLLKIIRRFLPFFLCAVILITVPIVINKSNEPAHSEEQTVLTLWQIDSFEGGRGSRSSYLQKIGNKFAEENNCFIRVTSLTAEAVRNNLKSGVAPDLISYGAGVYGLENYVNSYKCWCNGGYCLLTLDSASDFSDVCKENTVVNGGTDNLTAAAVLFEGLSGAEVQAPTGAYISLINGKFKYLFGTQRDIYRLKTREVAFSVKPLNAFNDLYQNISVITTDKKRVKLSDKFIEYLLNSSDSIADIGLLKSGQMLYGDEMNKMEDITYEYNLYSPLRKEALDDIKRAVDNCDLNLLKNLLK